MILTQLPDLPPRPETPGNAGARRSFYARWGQENAIISGHARRAEYAVIRQALSIKCLAGGTERYFLGRRSVCVTDASWLVLNEGNEYGSLLESGSGAYAFSLFLRPGLADEVAHAQGLDAAEALDEGREARAAPVIFHEQLRPHDARISPVLSSIQVAVARGERDEDWLEEQFTLLAGLLIREEHRHGRSREQALVHLRPAIRRELSRRLLFAEGYMREHLSESLPLRDIARHAALSPWHLLRRFRELHGTTPALWLRRLRVQRALRLRANESLTWDEIALAVGASRASLWRMIRQCAGERAEAVFSDRSSGGAGTGRRSAPSSSSRRRSNTPRAGARCHREPAST